MADATVLHHLPLTSSEQRMHDLTPLCWCEPVVISVSGKTSNVNHRKEETPHA